MSATASSDGAIRLMPPSIETSLAVDVDASSTIPPTASIVGVFVAPTGDVDARLGVDRSLLDGHGFTGTVGTTLLITSTDGTPGAAIGLGDPGSVTASSLRDAAASFARAAGKRVDLAIVAPTTGGVAPAEVAQALVEGVLLARYSFDALRTEPRGTPVRGVTVVVDDGDVDDARVGAQRGRVYAAATKLSRIWPIRRTAT